MLCNYFTLAHVARLIHQQCAGNKISELYSQHKRQLYISVESHPVQTIVVSCEPSENFIYIREGNFRARKNSVDLFPFAVGKKILNVACDASDRVIIMELEDKCSLECEMFGSRANILLWKVYDPAIGGKERTALVSSEVVVDAFLKKKELLGSRRAVKEQQTIPAYYRLTKNEDIFLDVLRTSVEEGPQPRRGILQSLKKAIPVLGSTLAKEILLRAEVHPSMSTSLTTDRELKRIIVETTKVISEATSPAAERQVRIYYEGQSPVCVSLIPLRTFDQYTYEPFPNAAAAIQRFVSTARASSTFAKDKEQISAWLGKEEKKAAQTLSKISSEIAGHDRASDYELFGKQIMTHLHELHKGMKSVALEDTFRLSGTHHRTVTIALDPALTPVVNAEKYFDKAKKARAAHEDSVRRMKLLEQRLTMLQSLKNELADVYSTEALKQFQQTYKTHLQEVGYMTTKEKEHLPPFRIFTVEGGFQVLAGKSSENNDTLTMKYAKPNDLWFHCRGSSGSHVVLKVSSAHGEPSKAAIHQAASIAAYYSKMKNASSVPVVMAEKKFVRKPKGAPAGTVVLEREKVIFVEPKLPQSHQ